MRKATKTTQATQETKLEHSSNTLRRKSSTICDNILEQGKAKKRIKGEPHANSLPRAPRSYPEAHASTKIEESKSRTSNEILNEKKWKSWSKDAHSSPFPDFSRPTEAECRQSYRILESLHGQTVRQNFEYTENSNLYYPYVMDALVVATLSQATSWANAQRAMQSMGTVYGSPFAYQKILDGGEEKLVNALRPGGMQNRKAKMLTQILVDVRERHGNWDLNHLFNATDDEAVKELISYKGVGPKSAFCILSICLQRNSFAVDTHIYRITGLWGWRPSSANREKAQAHLDARIPDDIKFSMHYLLIVHGRECPVCRGNGDAKGRCEYRELMREENA